MSYYHRHCPYLECPASFCARYGSAHFDHRDGASSGRPDPSSSFLRFQAGAFESRLGCRTRVTVGFVSATGVVRWYWRDCSPSWAWKTSWDCLCYHDHWPSAAFQNTLLWISHSPSAPLYDEHDLPIQWLNCTVLALQCTTSQWAHPAIAQSLRFSSKAFLHIWMVAFCRHHFAISWSDIAQYPGIHSS